jgi:hypothetical protein
MDFEFYYNQVPGEKPWRNNLIYTSLINKQKDVFVQWYHNDTEYHQGQNEVIDPDLMDEKWQREVKFLNIMYNNYPNLIPEILDIDYQQKKIYLKIQGVDFWQLHWDHNCTYDDILPDWQEQMCNIIRAHKSLNLYKFSMHPSSYFIINGKLKSINYFFTYFGDEKEITIDSFLSHISHNRRIELKKNSESLGIIWDQPTSFHMIQMLCFESFSNNYPYDFIEKAKEIYYV